MNKPISSNRTWVMVILISLIFASAFTLVLAAVPSGPSIDYRGNTTSSTSGVPTLEDNAGSQGGNIITLVLTARQQNDHYKAYVGNVTGSYVLEDADNYSIYEWTFTTIGGEVYATRRSSTVDWTSVECANSSHIDDEMSEMHHNSTNTADDALNDTFFGTESNDHWGFWAGDSQILPDSCNFSINTYVNDSEQTSTDLFDEVLLYDGSEDLIYATKIENDLIGYKNDSSTTYDFQMLIAENGSEGSSNTDYYFYVELS